MVNYDLKAVELPTKILSQGQLLNRCDQDELNLS